MPKKDTSTYNVRAVFTKNDAGQVFGPFSSLSVAEQCVLVLAGRSDIIKATIEKVE